MDHHPGCAPITSIWLSAFPFTSPFAPHHRLSDPRKIALSVYQKQDQQKQKRVPVYSRDQKKTDFPSFMLKKSLAQSVCLKSDVIGLRQ
jgi:hypothetical protein